MIVLQATSVAGLGGAYQTLYTYNQLNQLTRSTTSSSVFAHTLDVTMSPTGRIGTKTLSISSPAIGADLLYGYDNRTLTHQPRVIYDDATGRRKGLYWDADGNLVQLVDCSERAAYMHVWDEEDRLRMVVTPKNVGYYGYDASGERVYKLTGYTNVLRTNASRPEYGMDFVDITVYPSPYIVLSDKGYTKHFYAGTERIATLLGEGGLPFQYSTDDENHHKIIQMGFEDMMAGISVCPKPLKIGNVDICYKKHDELQYDCEPLCCTLFGTDAPYGGFAKLLETWSDSLTQVVNNVYFTHSDHLGSASWITDNSGKPIQYVHYAPYGDLVANQRLGGYDERFKFTGKERDTESG